MMQPQTEQAAVMAYLGPLITGETPETPIVRQIPREWLHVFWERVVPDLLRVVERTRGRWSLNTIAEHVLDGRWQLWIVWDGRIAAVLATELFTEDSGMKGARAVFVGGREMSKWAHLVTDLEDWARDNGAARFEMIISKGIARHFPDYRMPHVLLEKDLSNAEQI